MDSESTNSTFVHALSLLWNNKIDDGINAMTPLLESQEYIDQNLDELTDFFLLLIAKGQIYSAYKILKNGKIGIKWAIPLFQTC